MQHVVLVKLIQESKEELNQDEGETLIPKILKRIVAVLGLVKDWKELY